MADLITDRFSLLCDELESDGIINRETIEGCTDSEIQALADKYSIQIPKSYRLFLATMGRHAGRLTNYGEYDFDYETVLNLTAEKRRFAVEDGNRDSLDRVLGPHDLIILTRDGDYQLLIRCDGNSDPEVRYYFSDDFRTGFAYPSVFAIIKSIADECRRIKFW